MVRHWCVTIPIYYTAFQSLNSSVLSVRGLSSLRETLKNKAHTVFTVRCEMFLNPSITSTLFMWRGKEKEEVPPNVIHLSEAPEDTAVAQDY